MKKEKKNSIIKSTNLFEPLNFFMVRSPMLSLNFYKDLFENTNGEKVELEQMMKKLETKISDPIIQEAIFVSSSSLYNSIIDLNHISNKKRREQIIHSVNKYLIRMSTRPTPFGLFAGVTYGTFDSFTSFSIEKPLFHKKQTRPDMSWLLALIHKLESNIFVMKQLKVQVNSIILAKGERINVPYSSRTEAFQGNLFNFESSSIRMTPVVQLILELAKKPIKIDEIIFALKQKYTNVLEEKIHVVLLQLIEREYLVTELSPSLMIESPFEFLIEKLEHVQGIEELKIDLKQLNQLITYYDQKYIGEGLHVVKEINQQMKKIIATKDNIQIDVRLEDKDICLSKSVGEEVANVASVLWKLSLQYSQKQHLIAYRNDFLERYGIYREIPLLELLDEEMGIGSPATYTFPPSNRLIMQDKQELSSEYTDKILAVLLKTIKSNKMEIDLIQEGLVNELLEEEDFNKIPDSIEIYGSIVAESASEIDRGNFKFVTGLSTISDGAGKTFGRFLNILEEEEFIKNYKTIYSLEKNHSEFLYAEIVFLPSAGRLANVSLSRNFRDYEIVIGTQSSKNTKYTIPLSDIVVGSTNEKFYLKSKSIGKQLKIKTNHMLNISLAPNIYRFLVEISSYGTSDCLPFLWDSLNTSPFLPRITVGKSVLSLARWNVNNEVLKLPKETSFEKWKTTFYAWAAEWKMPQWVYQAVSDNRILLDIYNPIHIKELYIQSRNSLGNEKITLIEQESNTLKRWEEDVEGSSYNIEYVFPLIKNKKINSLDSIISIGELLPIDTNSECIKKFPGDNWLFIKLYNDSTRDEELIYNHIHEFCTNLVVNGDIDSYFFMRYADPKRHIRLRLSGDFSKGNMLYTLNQWFLSLNKIGLLLIAEISTYEREVERYGGPKLIGLAESLFYYDSLCVEQILRCINNDETTLSLEEISIISIIHYLECFNIQFQKQLEIINNVTSYKNYTKEFREKRDKYLQIGNSLNNWKTLSGIENESRIISILQIRKEAIQILNNSMIEVEKQGELYNTREDIILSIIHLHLNRLLGIDRELETKVMTLSRHVLHNLRYTRERLK
ncbi:lantibiotic dehydratase [Bacillus cereus]|uniref:Thiopeptide-type bacteriocin biosynthesis domain-containing protein n=1 Tax=Bacillus cereus TIAC219 TaxID=718222 RepID=A0ABC9SR22_BACCE|nr:lantibiotic dehydratase [Bacillus cereus]EJP85542.1 thiopeptide-type bacteriocin biosynthesis domain-containing protein [Bacillus cereus VD022]EOQ58142.1 thiopeptide-type bacteriocin biosynthesis domain-containing protein [Bacillus cereus TIAC219]EOQ59777.1 thiopeptide-type bacteriocin biosynthesis domain-containing protein [Bacillus cereus TIAC219]